MKPVAWRYENKNVKGKWYITWTEPPDGFNKRPLYEHQPEDETAWRELDDERVAYINHVGDILGQVGEDSLEDTATRVMRQLASRDAEVAKLKAWNIELVRQECLFADRCAQLREQVTLLHSLLKRWAFTYTDDETVFMEVQEALADTEPK